jgi:hypothetical protein
MRQSVAVLPPAFVIGANAVAIAFAGADQVNGTTAVVGARGMAA